MVTCKDAVAAGIDTNFFKRYCPGEKILIPYISRQSFSGRDYALSQQEVAAGV